ncbi:hypothetical protein AVEN_234142-1 [Araneus ventricosus]|uniref:Uncharacterized protein n=1 Tax=Araneus ventricosus TaxID=182803 RepID=A0A4Y2X7L5_ARAVE|nr:hypothetical protein AVEN_234142-1 [Araneus ventricosus]
MEERWYRILEPQVNDVPDFSDLKKGGKKPILRQMEWSTDGLPDLRQPWTHIRILFRNEFGNTPRNCTCAERSHFHQNRGKVKNGRVMFTFY